MTAAKKITKVGCSSTTSNTVLRGQLGTYPIAMSRSVRRVKQQKIKEGARQKKRAPAIADSAVREKLAKKAELELGGMA